MASIPEIISILIIRGKLETVSFWARHEANGLIAKEKQGNASCSVCSLCKIWLFQPRR